MSVPNPNHDELPIFLERFAGKSFERCRYSERRFIQPYERCDICYRTISERPHQEAVSTGFVVRLFVGEDSSWPQWEWVCEDCFEQFQVSAGWLVLPEGVSVGGPERGLARASSNSAPPARELEVISVGWTADDIVGIAQTIGVKLSAEECKRFVERNAPLFIRRIGRIGDSRLVGLLQLDYLASQKKQD